MDKSLLSKNYVLITGAATLFYIASFMLNTVTGKYSLEIGADKTIAGVITAVFTLSSFVSRPVWGYITDTKGRKISFLSGAMLCVVSSVMLIFTETILILALSRAVFGVGYSAFTTAGGTMICDVVPEKTLSKAISFYGITNVLSQALAPAAALWLYEKSFKTVAIAVVVLTAVSLAAGIFIRYREIEHINPENRFRIYEKTALPAAFTIFFFAVAIASVYSFIPVMAEERQIEHTGLFFIVSATGLMISRIFNTKFCNKTGETKVFYIGTFLFAAGFGIIAFVQKLFLLLIAAALYGIGAGLIHPVVNTAAVKNCKSENRGLATGTFMMSQDIGMTAGAVLWGYISEKAGFTAVYLTVVFIGFTMAAVFKKLLHKMLENE